MGRHDEWHAREANEVASLLETGADGLSSDQARRRLDEYGPNRVEEEPPPNILVLLLHQFRSPLIYILVVAAVVTLALGDYIDTGVIVAVLLANAVIGFVQEHQAEASIRSLIRMVSPHARVIRDGRVIEIESRDLVPGDRVLLESGNRVPADIRLSDVIALMVDESLLTGESAPVVKRVDPVEPDVTIGDRLNLAYAGTTVTSGRSTGYVVATGERTELGKIALEVRREQDSTTPLQRQMTRFANIIVMAILASGLLTFAIGVARGEAISDMFHTVVAMAVAAVPEGLPIVVTVTLAISVRRMAARNAIIRQLPAAETLGGTTVIGSDKTGTLTENRMTVQALWLDERIEALDDLQSDDLGLISLEEHLLSEQPSPEVMTLVAGVLCNEASYSPDEDGAATGDPTDVASLVAASRAGLDPDAVRDAVRFDAMLPFEPDRRFSAAACRVQDASLLFVKGAPEQILSMSGSTLTADGERPLDQDQVLAAAGELASRGLRVLAMAYRRLDAAPESELELESASGLTLLGLQGMMDPPREGVREAIAGCQRAGIRVVMITGDHLETARAIARDLQIGKADDPVLSGVDLMSMDDEELRERVPDVSIYARMAPEHKLRVVHAYQRHGETVAVTGDGVNDAPALRSADIGVAMGKSGTDIAREASDMVLTDDNFVTIYAAVEEGRVVFDNLRKVTFFLISSGAALIVAIIATILLEWPLPMVPAQILWLNLVTNGLQDVALAFEPGAPGIMDRPPRPRRERMISRLLWERTVVAGLVMAAGMLYLFDWSLNSSGSLAEAQTVALTTMVLFQAFHVGNARSTTRSVFRISPFSNRFLLIAVMAALAVHAAALYLPPTQFVLRVEPIGFDAWVRMTLVALTIVAAVELHKLVRRQ